VHARAEADCARRGEVERPVDVFRRPPEVLEQRLTLAGEAGESKLGIGSTIADKFRSFKQYYDTLFPPAKETHMKYPPDELRLHLVDIHFYSGNLDTQYIAHHYCTEVKQGFQQCLLTDHNDRDAKVIGTEFVISKDLFEALPDEEKPLWHSHFFEVKSGLLVAPDLPEEEEWKVMDTLIKTYGKVVDVYHQGLDMPIGPPLLANALALDEQVDWDFADYMDKELRLPTTHRERREKRKALKDPEIAKGADNYLQTGKAPQFKTFFVPMEDNGRILHKNKKGLDKHDKKSKKRTESSHDSSEF